MQHPAGHIAFMPLAQGAAASISLGIQVHIAPDEWTAVLRLLFPTYDPDPPPKVFCKQGILVVLCLSK